MATSPLASHYRSATNEVAALANKNAEEHNHEARIRRDHNTPRPAFLKLSATMVYESCELAKSVVALIIKRTKKKKKQYGETREPNNRPETFLIKIDLMYM